MSRKQDFDMEIVEGCDNHWNEYVLQRISVPMILTGLRTCYRREWHRMTASLTLVANCPGLPELAAVSWSTMTEECEFAEFATSVSVGFGPVRFAYRLFVRCPSLW
jgi:hypothetical protein